MYKYNKDMESIVVTHNAGFFSCYTIRLLSIISYFNKNKKCPLQVDSSQQFKDYKIHANRDYTDEYIKNDNFPEIEHLKDISINSEDGDQFSNYKNINFQMVKPFIRKYFSPSDNILNLVQKLEIKYDLDYENLAAFYYRGTDKYIETNICDYKTYIEKAEQLKIENPTLKFLITSDDIHLINLFRTTFPDTIICEELLDKSSRSFEHSQLMLANVLMMSRANVLICSSSNVSLWIVLFRGHGGNLHQYLNHKEYIYDQRNKLFSPGKSTYWI